MNPDTMTPFTIRGYAVHQRRDNDIDYAFPVEEMEVRTHTFWESEVRRLNECIAREALMLLSRQDAREEEEEENDDDDDDTDNIEQNMSEHTNPNEDVDSEPEWVDIPVLGAEAIQGNDVAAVETEPVNQEGETSASVKGRMSDEYSVIRKPRTKRKMETGKNRMEDAVTVQTLPISEDGIREDDSCGTIGKQKRRKMRTLGDIMSCSTPTSNGGGPQGNILHPSSSEGAPLGTGLSPMTSSGGAPMEISLSPSTSTGGDTLGMNLDPSTSTGGGAPVNDLNSSNSSGGFALGFNLNELPPDQEEDWISPEPPAAENHAEGEVQGSSVNDQTVSSSMEKCNSYALFLQSESSRCVHQEHCNTESRILEPENDDAGREVVHSDHRTPQDGEQMFQRVNGKLPLLSRGSGQQGHKASANQANTASGHNAVSERANPDGTTDPTVRNLYEPAQSTVEAQTIANDQTVSSSKGKGKMRLPEDQAVLSPYARFLQSGASRCVQQGHNNAESSIVELGNDDAGRRLLQSDHRTPQDGEQMFQIVNGKLPLPLPGYQSPTQGPRILLRGSERHGHAASGNRGNRASGRNAASGLDGTTDLLVRNLYEPARSTVEAQPTIATSSRCYGNHNSSYRCTQEPAATGAPVFHGYSGRDGAYQRSAEDSSQERLLSGSHFPLGASSSSEGGSYQPLPALIGGSCNRSQPISWGSTIEAQPTVGTSYGNQSFLYRSTQETTATRAPGSLVCSSGAGAYQRSALPLSQETSLSGSHFPLDQQLAGLVAGSSNRCQPVSRESWRNCETLSYSSQLPAGSLTDQGRRFPESCFGTSQESQTSQAVPWDERLAQSSLSQNSLYFDSINHCARLGLERTMRLPPQLIYSGRDTRIHPNASPPTDMLRFMDPGIHYRTPIHQQSSMPRDNHRLDMSRLEHSRSNGPLYPQSTSTYLNRNNYPGSFTGMSPVPQPNSASFPSLIQPPVVPVPEPILPPAIPAPVWPSAIPVPEPILPPAVPVPDVNHQQGIDVCRTNQNPAEFNTPESRNKHMTGYRDVQQR